MFRRINQYNQYKIFFTSDTHFFHKNILKYTARPFDSVEEMDQKLIENWNSVVSNDDDIFFLGDFAFTGNIDRIAELVNTLNGRIHLILGNHDHQNKFTREAVLSLFESAQDYLEIDVIDEEMELPQRIVMSHYSMITWNVRRRGSWQLFGHIHSRPRSQSGDAKLPLGIDQYDVGVDNNNYTPISYEEIKTIITKKYLNNK